MGEIVIVSASGREAWVPGRLGSATGQATDPQIMHLHPAWGPKAGQAGMHPCALG
jgi:hypothetical protein